MGSHIYSYEFQGVLFVFQPCFIFQGTKANNLSKVLNLGTQMLTSLHVQGGLMILNAAPISRRF